MDEPGIEAQFSDGWKPVTLVGWRGDPGDPERRAQVVTTDGRSALFPREKLRGLPEEDGGRNLLAEPDNLVVLEALSALGYTLENHVPWQTFVEVAPKLGWHPSTVRVRFRKMQAAAGIVPPPAQRGKSPAPQAPVRELAGEETFFTGTDREVIDHAAELEAERKASRGVVEVLETAYTPGEIDRFNELLEQGRRLAAEAAANQPARWEDVPPETAIINHHDDALPKPDPPPCPGTPEQRPLLEAGREIARLCGSLLDDNELAILVAAKQYRGIYAAFAQLPADKGWSAERKARWLEAVKAAADLEIDGEREGSLDAREKHLAGLLAVGSLSPAGSDKVGALEPERRLLVLWRAIEVLNAVVR